MKNSKYKDLLPVTWCFHSWILVLILLSTFVTLNILPVIFSSSECNWKVVKSSLLFSIHFSPVEKTMLSFVVRTLTRLKCMHPALFMLFTVQWPNFLLLMWFCHLRYHTNVSVLTLWVWNTLHVIFVNNLSVRLMYCEEKKYTSHCVCLERGLFIA